MENFWDGIANWSETNRASLVEVAVILFVALLVTRFGEVIIKRAVARTVRRTAHRTEAEERKRERTISDIISGVLGILVWPIALISVLAQLGVEIAPLIAGMGIAGLALGFGAQTLVKDVISGLFIIIENQYGVGDVVELEGTPGVVEEISLRKTTLRDLDGIVHHIPNGTITMASNLSSEYSGINLDVGVSYDANLEKVIKVIDEVGAAMAKDEKWAGSIIEQPKFLRVENFGASSVDLKITGKVQPLTQWEVTGELRMRLKIAFDKAGIEIPFPQTVIHQSKD